jgi:hypothetical protein
MLGRTLIAALFALWSSAALAWFDEGHMRVAAMAYELLTPAAKAEANRLIRLNPRYDEWKAAVPPNADGTAGDVDRYTFIRAAVWADDIKNYKPYQDASDPKKGLDLPNDPKAGENLGYSDLRIHGYWHYMDIGFSWDGTPVQAADPANALTQIKLFTAALPASSGKSDDIRSYDLVWLLHLVGDVHQPLHSSALFSHDLSLAHQLKGEADTGDRGGNEIMVSPATGVVTDLHKYWDGIFGGYSTVSGAIFDGFRGKDKTTGRAIPTILWSTNSTLLAETDPEQWVKESHDVALRYAYAEPIRSGRNVIELTREYETNARRAAEDQLAIAAGRLARLINDAFDGR